MSTFADRVSAHGSATAIVGDGGLHLSYAELSARADEFGERLTLRNGLLVIEAQNEVEAIIAYIAALRSRTPVMLTPAGRDDLRAAIRANYRPEWIYSKSERGWQLETFEQPERPAAHPELAVLLCTSGSTGSAKFVRLSRTNLEANARSIVEYLEIEAGDRAATTLPFHYSYGLSVINSHLYAGASLMLTSASVTDASFWSAVETHAVTSFAGVPYTFELLDRIGFGDERIESLRYVTEAGGRLPAEKVARYAAIARAQGWRFYVMYGQTEATARMAYVPPALLEANPGSIGIPIPGGAFSLIDERGEEIVEADRPGALVYRGPNVMMGYAERREDLQDGPGTTELETGDIAQRNAAGLYTIVGRTKRIIKVFGLRIGLDEVERKLAAEGIRGVATGVDEALVVGTLDRGASARIRALLVGWCKLPAAVVHVVELDDYPLLPSGKVDYATLAHLRDAEPEHAPDPTRTIRKILQTGTGAEVVRPTDTFVSLGGDSLSYIGVSLELEKFLGYVPEHWERRTLVELEALEPRRSVWSQIETSILLRAAAILCIVCNHFGVFETPLFERLGIRYPGGAAMLLLVVAGFNFAQFQLPEAARRGALPILRTIGRIALPTAAFLLTIELVSGKFQWSTILMYSNFIGPNVNFGIEPWFIYVLLQILAILAVIVSIPAVRGFAERSGYGFCLTVLALATLTSLAGPLVWDTDPLLNRTPHIVMYGFMLGACISLGAARWQRFLHSGLLIAYLAAAAEYFTWVALAGGLVLVWTHHLWLIWPLHRIAGALGSASLFIYLSHHNFRQYTHRLLTDDSIALDVGISLLGGIALWWGWQKVTELASGILRRVRADA